MSNTLHIKATSKILPDIWWRSDQFPEFMKNQYLERAKKAFDEDSWDLSFHA